MREKNLLAHFIYSSPSSKFPCYLSSWSSKKISGFVSGMGKQLQKGSEVLNTVYVNEALLYMRIFRWFRRFLLQHEDLEHDPGFCGGHQLLEMWELLQRIVKW